MVQWLETFSYGAEGPEFKSWLGSVCDWKTLSTQQQMGTFFESGKDKAEKGERWAPPSYAVPKMQ